MPLTIPPRRTEFFVAGGTLPADAPSYVKRPTDDVLYEKALRGEFAYVLTARQMGKSSLMTRTAQRLETEAQVRTARIDLSQIGTQSVETWYRDLLENMARDLRLEVDLDLWWQTQGQRGTLQRFHNFLADVVLAEIEGPVVIFIDEIDYTIRLDFSDDFFGAIRATYNNRAKAPAFNRLTFVLLGTASPTELIKDRTRTPFNIGQGILLQDFSQEDAQVLHQGLEERYPGQGEGLLAAVYGWTSGHPYLTQKVCGQLVAEGLDAPDVAQVDGIVERLFLADQSNKEDNLQFVQDSLLSHPPRQQRHLLTLYRDVYQGKPTPDDPQSITHNQLKLSGVVKAVEGQLEVRNLLYRQVFDLDWVRRHTKIDWNRIVARGAVALVMLLLLAFGYEYWATQDINASFGKFHQSTDPQEQAELLGHIVQLPRLLGEREHHDRVQAEFFELPSREKQLALFAPNVASQLSPRYLAALVENIYVTLADVENNNQNGPLLEQMGGALATHSAERCQRLETEIKQWLVGREQAQQGQYEAALEAYNAALALNPGNDAVRYERARVYVFLEQDDVALQELDQLLGGLQAEPTAQPDENERDGAEGNTNSSGEQSVSGLDVGFESPLIVPPSSPLLVEGENGGVITDTKPLPKITSTPSETEQNSSIATTEPANQFTPFISQFRTARQRIEAVSRNINRTVQFHESFLATVQEYPNLSQYQTQLTNFDFLITTEKFSIAGMNFIRIPAGEFIMGSSDGQVDYACELYETYFGSDCSRSFYEDEQPQRFIYLDEFWIMQTEVTNRQYQRFIDAQGYLTARYWSESGRVWRLANQVTQPACWNDDSVNGAEYPVVCVSWFEAEAYANWLSEETGLNFGLPTEAQWERAARGADGRIYPWGNQWDGQRTNYCDTNCTQEWADGNVNDGYARTAPVGSYPLGGSPYGALDMAGNVWEWTADWYSADGYEGLPTQNPTGPSSGDRRVLRGGSWFYNPDSLRAADRGRNLPHGRNHAVGVRLRLSSSPDSPLASVLGSGL